MSTDENYKRDLAAQAEVADYINLMMMNDEDVKNELADLKNRISVIKNRMAERARHREFQTNLKKLMDMHDKHVRVSLALHAADYRLRMHSPETVATRIREIQNEISQAGKMEMYLRSQWNRLTAAEQLQRLRDDQPRDAQFYRGIVGADEIEREAIALVRAGPPHIRRVQERINELTKTIEMLENPAKMSAVQRARDIAKTEHGNTITALDAIRNACMQNGNKQELAMLDTIWAAQVNDVQTAISKQQKTIEYALPEDQQNVQSRARMMQYGYTGPIKVVLSDTAQTMALNVRQLQTLENTESIYIEHDDMIPMDEYALLCLAQIGKYAGKTGVHAVGISPRIPMVPDGFRALFGSLQPSSAIVTLVISGTSLDDNGCEHLGRFIHQAQSLMNLRLVDTGFQKRGADFISEGIQHNTTLTAIEIVKANIDNDGVISLCNAIQFSSCPIKRVTIDQVKLSDNIESVNARISAISAMISTKPALQLLNVCSTTWSGDKVKLSTHSPASMHLLTEAVLAHPSLRSVAVGVYSSSIDTHLNERENRRKEEIGNFIFFQTTMLSGNFKKLPKHVMVQVKNIMKE